MSGRNQFLSDKRTLLSAPGVKMNDLYYSLLNSSVNLVESTFNMGRLAVSLSQTTFGSSSQVIIPNASLLDGVYLRLVLPAIGATDNLILGKGWGYTALAGISFQLGAANVGLLSYNRQAVFQMVLSECETSEKASEYFNLSGEEQLGSSTVAPVATVFLPFPWSSTCARTKKPFDTTLLANPITLSIQLSRADEIYGGPGVLAGRAPGGFTVAQCLMHQGELADKSMGLKPAIMKNPDMMYSYPWVHRQLFTSAPFLGNSSPATPINITLQSLINADLIAISFGVVNTANLSSVSGSLPQPFNYHPVSNVVLTYNGQVQINCPELTYRNMNMRSIPGAGYYENSVISTGLFGFPPYNTQITRTYCPLFNFSRVRNVCDQDEMANCWRLGNNSLNLAFNTAPGSDGATFLLYCVYHYTAIAQVDSSGSSSIYFS